jgi:hypothetical protein
MGNFIEGFAGKIHNNQVCLYVFVKITCQDDCKKLQSVLDAAARWEADWLMAFHPDKSTVITITQNKKHFKHDYILQPCGSPDVTGTVLDVTPSNTTVCVLSDKNA